MSPWDNLEVDFPFTEPLPSNSECSTGAFSAEILNGDVLELRLDVVSITANSSCSDHFFGEFDITVEIPQLGSAAAPMYLKPVSLTPTTTALYSVRLSVETGPNDAANSAKLGRVVGLPFSYAEVSWLGSGLSIQTNTSVGRSGQDSIIQSAVPGDSLTFRIRVSAVVSASSSRPTQGTFVARFEFRELFPNTVPEPSASLSLPIGAGALLILAMARAQI